jgi:hypothetical protein
MNKQQNNLSEEQSTQIEDLTVVEDRQAEVKGGPFAGRDVLIGGEI